MTDHAARAESLIEGLDAWDTTDPDQLPQANHLVAIAQVHATLAAADRPAGGASAYLIAFPDQDEPERLREFAIHYHPDQAAADLATSRRTHAHLHLRLYALHDITPEAVQAAASGAQ